MRRIMIEQTQAELSDPHDSQRPQARVRVNRHLVGQ